MRFSIPYVRGAAILVLLFTTALRAATMESEVTLTLGTDGMQSFAYYNYTVDTLRDATPQRFEQYHVIVNGGVDESTALFLESWSNMLHSEVAPASPNCYNARITITVYSGPASWCCTTAESYHDEAGVQCLQGPPSPTVVEDPEPKDEPIDYIPLEQGLGDPLILDLNGDGIHTTPLSWPVTFDMLGDGARATMAWTDPATEEGFLWIDLFPNNRVDDGRELFGTGTVLPSGSRARDGFEALSVYDQPSHRGNGDGRIDHSDAIWSKLRLWVDRDHDGESGSNEVRPLHESSVLAILLPVRRVTGAVRDSHGNLHVIRTHYSIRDGNTAFWREIHNLEFLVADQ